ncbi:MAG: FHA domain-containing protein [Methylococcaceae bacterium]|nr:FHA domain-containing protein [Methylococcaceae bacterium]
MAKVQLFFAAKLQAEYSLDDKSELTVGRSPSCDIIIDNGAVSRHHCILKGSGQEWKLIDADSANGTFVNGTAIKEYILQHQDRIVVGKYTLLFDRYGSKLGEDSVTKDASPVDGTVFLNRDALMKMVQRSQRQQGMALVLEGTHRQVVPLQMNITTIGKNERCDLRIGGLFVRDEQALVVKTEFGHKIIHQGGVRGMVVNGMKRHEAILRAGDRILIAGHKISYGTL